LFFFLNGCSKGFKLEGSFVCILFYCFGGFDIFHALSLENSPTIAKLSMEFVDLCCKVHVGMEEQFFFKVYQNHVIASPFSISFT
jgi:hypothetical protein